MNSNDFVKYLTVQLVEKMENPKNKIKSKRSKGSFSYHWFGLIPLSFKIMAKRLSKNKHNV